MWPKGRNVKITLIQGFKDNLLGEISVKTRKIQLRCFNTSR